MARVQSPFSRMREILDSSLDKLNKYGNDPEWQTVPGYEERVAGALNEARMAFGNLLEMVLPDKKFKKVDG